MLHGFTPSTKDYESWLDPLPDATAWAGAVQELIARDPSLPARRIDPLSAGACTEISMSAIALAKTPIAGEIPVAL